jgi:hypothetical protein
MKIEENVAYKMRLVVRNGDWREIANKMNCTWGFLSFQ